MVAVGLAALVAHSSISLATDEQGAPPAAKEAAGGHGGGHAAESPSILTGDLGNVFWTATIFIVLLMVLRATAWKPILTALQKREEFITNSINDARREREEAQRMLAEYTKKVEQARADAQAIVEEGRRDAEEVRKRIHADARSEADALVARARKEIELARDDAVKQLYDRTVTLATNVAAKVVRKELSPGDHKRLLDESLAELSQVK